MAKTTPKPEATPTPPPLTRDQIFTARTFPTHPVALPELGGTVYARTMTAAEFLDLNERIDADKANAFAFWIIDGITDADARPLFTEADVERLRDLPIGVVERMTAGVQRHNFVARDDAKGKSDAPASA